MVGLIFAIQVWKVLQEFSLKSSLEESKEKRYASTPKNKSLGKKEIIFIWFGRIKQNLYDALVLFFLTETFNLNSVNCHYQCLWNLWEFQLNFYSTEGFMLSHTILIWILCINLNTLILMIQCSLCFVFKILPAANRVRECLELGVQMSFTLL